MVNVCIFYDHLEYFMAIWYNLWPFVTVCDHLLYFSRFKNLATLEGKSKCHITTYHMRGLGTF
jgi:hypothetical protein